MHIPNEPIATLKHLAGKMTAEQKAEINKGYESLLGLLRVHNTCNFYTVQDITEKDLELYTGTPLMTEAKMIVLHMTSMLKDCYLEDVKTRLREQVYKVHGFLPGPKHYGISYRDAIGSGVYYLLYHIYDLQRKRGVPKETLYNWADLIWKNLESLVPSTHFALLKICHRHEWKHVIASGLDFPGTVEWFKPGIRTYIVLAQLRTVVQRMIDYTSSIEGLPPRNGVYFNTPPCFLEPFFGPDILAEDMSRMRMEEE